MRYAVKKARSAYARYELAKEHLNAAQAVEDIFRKGFVMGYHTACDEFEQEQKKKRRA